MLECKIAADVWKFLVHGCRTTWILMKVLLSSVRVAKNPQLYFARRLNDAMVGAGTDESTLIRIIVCRSEVSAACRGS